MKRFFRRIGEFLGLPRNSRYVKDYLNEANVRSGVFMSGIIVALEIWLVFRQWNKYIAANWNSPKFPHGNFQYNNALLTIVKNKSVVKSVIKIGNR